MYEQNRWKICKLQKTFSKKKKKRKFLAPKKFTCALPFFLSPKPRDCMLSCCSPTLILEDFQSKCIVITISFGGTKSSPRILLSHQHKEPYSPHRRSPMAQRHLQVYWRTGKEALRERKGPLREHGAEFLE